MSKYLWIYVLMVVIAAFIIGGAVLLQGGGDDEEGFPWHVGWEFVEESPDASKPGLNDDLGQCPSQHEYKPNVESRILSHRPTDTEKQACLDNPPVLLLPDWTCQEFNPESACNQVFTGSWRGWHVERKFVEDVDDYIYQLNCVSYAQYHCELGPEQLPPDPSQIQ